MSQTHIIIVAAGSGTRFGAEVPKQFCLLGDTPVLMRTCVNLGRALPGAQMAVVLSQEYAEYWQRLCLEHGFISPRVVIGGATRWESVKRALEAIAPAPDDTVLVHDGVRPVVTRDMMRRITEAMACADAAIPAIAVTDSLRRKLPDGCSEAVDRSTLVAVQTPQAFRAGKLLQAYALPYSPAFTDDASVFEAAGFGCPALVEGSPLNIKITHPRDLDVAALFLGLKD